MENSWNKAKKKSLSQCHCCISYLTGDWLAVETDSPPTRRHNTLKVVPTEHAHLRCDGYVETHMNNITIFHHQLTIVHNTADSTIATFKTTDGNLGPFKGEDQHASVVTKCDTVQQSAYSALKYFSFRNWTPKDDDTKSVQTRRALTLGGFNVFITFNHWPSVVICKRVCLSWIYTSVKWWHTDPPK